jgi:hypothetical protein
MENLKTQATIPEPDWYKNEREENWDLPEWEDSAPYQEELAKLLTEKSQFKELEPQAKPVNEESPLQNMRVDEEDLVLEIPMNRIRHLVGQDEVISIEVHGKPLFINKGVLCDLAGGAPFEKINLKSVKESLEESLSVEEVDMLRKSQTRSITLGSEYYLVEGEPVLDMSQFKVHTPSLATKLRVEIADQDVELEGFSLLNGVKPEFRNIAKGLERIIKTPIAAHILNIIQEQDPKQEMAFYAKVFDCFTVEANTFTLGLGMMRHLMQYALNVDALELRSILTNEFLNRGTENEC